MPRQFDIPQDVISKVQTGELLPSAYAPYLSAIHGEHIIGINNAYLLGDWQDVVFFGDCAWYNVHKRALAKFRNLKVTCCPRFENRPLEAMEGIKFLRKDSAHPKGISSNPKMVSWNKNSGAAAISLARHFGVRRIVLLGFDMSLGHKGASHWHRGHGNRRLAFKTHLEGFPHIARDAVAMGIEILNCSPESEIQDFPKVGLKEVLP